MKPKAWFERHGDQTFFCFLDENGAQHSGPMAATGLHDGMGASGGCAVALPGYAIDVPCRASTIMTMHRFFERDHREAHGDDPLPIELDIDDPDAADDAHDAEVINRMVDSAGALPVCEGPVLRAKLAGEERQDASRASTEEFLARFRESGGGGA